MIEPGQPESPASDEAGERPSRVSMTDSLGNHRESVSVSCIPFYLLLLRCKLRLYFRVFSVESSNSSSARRQVMVAHLQ